MQKEKGTSISLERSLDLWDFSDDRLRNDGKPGESVKEGEGGMIGVHHALVH